MPILLAFICGPAFGFWVTNAWYRVEFMLSHINGIHDTVGIVAFAILYVMEGTLRMAFFPILWWVDNSTNILYNIHF